MRAWLNSRGIPNVRNASVASKLSLSPKPTSTKITVANGQKTTCLGSIEDVSVLFNGTVNSLNVLVVEGSPVDILIGNPTLEELQACIDLGHQSLRMVIRNKTVKIVWSLTQDVLSQVRRLIVKTSLLISSRSLQKVRRKKRSMWSPSLAMTLAG